MTLPTQYKDWRKDEASGAVMSGHPKKENKEQSSISQPTGTATNTSEQNKNFQEKYETDMQNLRIQLQGIRKELSDLKTSASQPTGTATNTSEQNKNFQEKYETDMQNLKNDLKCRRKEFSDLMQSYMSKTKVLYPPTIAISFAAFVIVLVLTTYIFPQIKESPQQSNDKFQISLALSITAGIAPLIVSAAINSIQIDDQNAQLSAKSIEIRNKRSDIALLRRRQIIDSAQRAQTSTAPAQSKKTEEEPSQKMVQLLKSGMVQEFNKKREDSKYEPLDFKGMDLNGLYLRDANLTKIDLTKANLTLADLVGNDTLQECKLDQAQLVGTFLFKANLYRASMKGANLNRTQMGSASLIGADLSNAVLSGTNLTKSKIMGAKLVETKLFDSDLTDADLQSADLSNAKFNQGTVLTGTILKDVKNLPITEKEATERGARVKEDQEEFNDGFYQNQT
jgi:uncharacterized protein YjbI with pentapeptide repeats